MVTQETIVFYSVDDIIHKERWLKPSHERTKYQNVDKYYYVETKTHNLFKYFIDKTNQSEGVYLRTDEE